MLKALRDKASGAAPPTVMAIADTYKDHLTKVTLRRSFAARADYPRSFRIQIWYVGFHGFDVSLASCFFWVSSIGE